MAPLVVVDRRTGKAFVSPVGRPIEATAVVVTAPCPPLDPVLSIGG